MGLTAPNTAMLHAVNVPATPEANANAMPAATPAIGVALASWPSSVSAMLSPIVESTNWADQITVSPSPAMALSRTTSQGRRGKWPFTNAEPRVPPGTGPAV